MATTIRNIGETIEVTFSNGSTHTCDITGRNWCGDQFVSYIIRHNHCDLTVNVDGKCQWSFTP